MCNLSCTTQHQGLTPLNTFQRQVATHSAWVHLSLERIGKNRILPKLRISRQGVAPSHLLWIHWLWIHRLWIQ